MVIHQKFLQKVGGTGIFFKAWTKKSLKEKEFKRSFVSQSVDFFVFIFKKNWWELIFLFFFEFLVYQQKGVESKLGPAMLSKSQQPS